MSRLAPAIVPEKKNHPILLRLPDSLHERLQAAAERTTQGRQDIIRSGIIAELDRLDAQASNIAPDLANRIHEAQRLGLDVRAVLSSAIARAVCSARPDPFPHRD